jgi:hypothetical protein
LSMKLCGPVTSPLNARLFGSTTWRGRGGGGGGEGAWPKNLPVDL